MKSLRLRLGVNIDHVATLRQVRGTPYPDLIAAARLCEAAGAVVAVERDRDLEPALAETTAACKRFALVCADAVDVDPIAVAEPFGRPRALVANLPYGVAATVVLRFFEILPSLEQATVMVQSEVADRMAAAPSTKAYGAYTVKLVVTNAAGERAEATR